MGLDVYLYDGENDACPRADVPLPNGNVLTAVRQELNSEKHPDHLFKRTYLRSSYNEGGFNSVCKSLIGKDLYWVFEPSDEYEIPFSADALAACAERAATLTRELAAATSSKAYRVATIDTFFSASNGVQKDAAIQVFMDELKRHPDGEMGYSNRHGDFFGTGENALRVVAAVAGVDFAGKPAVHLVYEADLSWYVQAAEIVEEFIAHAMTLQAPVLHWSA